MSSVGPPCMFCDLDALRENADVTFENDLCLLANEAGIEILPGSAVTVPKSHRPDAPGPGDRSFA